MPLPEPASPSVVTEITDHVQLRQEGDLVLVIMAGVPWAQYERWDRAAENWAMVSLVQRGLARLSAVAVGFGVERRRIYRCLQRQQREGLAGLVDRKRGPKGPRLLKGAQATQMLALHRQGMPKAHIAARLGVTEGAVRKALQKQGVMPRGAEQLALPGTHEATAQAVSAAQPKQCEEPVSAAPAEVQELASAPAPSSTQSLLSKFEAHGTEQSWDRTADRALARLGLLDEARPQFGPAQGVRGAGALLAIPALVESGLLEEADRVLSLGRGFYGLRSVLLTLLLMGLLRVKRPEGLRSRSPLDLGRLLGLDRAPEVKTLRRKVRTLSQQQHSEELMAQLAQRRAERQSEAMGFLYVDGHVRAYHGQRDLPKTHVARIRLSMPATVDHWVNDREGDPLLVVTATETASLSHELPAILEQVRSAVGNERRVTVVFDRGGWSPALFAQMVAQGFDVLTYRKGKGAAVPVSEFQEYEGVFDGRPVRYALCERPLLLLGGKLELREVVRLCPDGQHQTQVVTSRKDLSALEVAYRMFERWRQENFFKYMRQHFALDTLWGYGQEPGDAQRLVPNPARKELERQIETARDEVRTLEQKLGAAALANEEARRPTMRGFKIANADIGRPLGGARQRLEALLAQRRQVPSRIPAQQAAGQREVVRLDRESKRLTDVVKMVAYQAESALVHLARPHYARHAQEGRSLVAAALRLKGDLVVRDGELRVTLEPMASPNRTRALAQLCSALNDTDTLYPGTSLVMRYAIRAA